jgi:hypothetical protein
MEAVRMRWAGRVFAAITLCVGSHGLVWAQGGESAPAPAPFPTASIHFEQNATDGDAEVVFEVKGGDEGLSKLIVRTPDGRTVINVVAADRSTLGMRQFRFESPEPRDATALKAAYPEGVYTFEGATASGTTLKGTAKLNHKLPAPVTDVRPRDSADNIALRNLAITWKPVAGLAAYLVYIEQTEQDVNVSAKLPATATSFIVPDGFLRPRTAYQLGIGTVTEEGNVSFVETTFVTADKP